MIKKNRLKKIILLNFEYLKLNIWTFSCRHYKLPLTCDLYIGNPGAGKTTIASYFVRQDLKHNMPVWSNVDIKGAMILEPKTDFGNYDISNGRVIIDEIGVFFNNRNFKTNISDNMMSWLKKYRHYKVHIDCFSQGLDFDNRFLGLARNVYIVRRSLIPFFVARVKVDKRICIDKDKHELVDGYFKHFLGIKLYFMPVAWKYFNSYEVDYLPPKEWKTY